jgi:phage FluMu gp28-like protein
MNLLLPIETQADRKARIRAAYWLATQERWIKSKARLKIMQKTRRYGGSYANAYSVAEKTSKKGQIFDSWVGSRDLLAARLGINDIKLFSKILSVACIDRGEVALSDDKALRAFEVEFANGRFARGLSSSPDAFAGKQGNITLDEFALHKDPRQLYGIVQPGIMRGGSLSIISTHRGTGNFFNELIKEVTQKGNPKRFDLFTITIEEAVKEGLWLKIQQTLEDNGVEDERLGWDDEAFLQSLRNECATEEMWLQEYMCQPCDDNSALLTWEELLGASRTQTELDAVLSGIPANAPRFLGMDIGRRNHPSVIWQWVKHNGLLITEKILPLLNMPFAQQEAMLIEMMNAGHVQRACIDATGLGMQLAENAAKACPGRIDQVTFNPQRKVEMATHAKRIFQDRGALIPDTAKIQYELYSIKQTAGAADSVVITSEAGLSDGHSDYAWAAFLGIRAAGQNAAPFGWSPLHSRSQLSEGLVQGAIARAKRIIGL